MWKTSLANSMTYFMPRGRSDRTDSLVGLTLLALKIADLRVFPLSDQRGVKMSSALPVLQGATLDQVKESPCKD